MYALHRFSFIENKIKYFDFKSKIDAINLGGSL